MKTTITTGKVRLSYVTIWEPKAIDAGQAPKYSVSILIPKSDTATVNKIRAAIEAAKTDARAQRIFGGKVPANLRLPLRDGDTEKPDDLAYQGCYFINANSAHRPKVVGLDLQEIIDPEEVYSGCYGRVNINFYSYSMAGNRGIACGLNAIQKIADGEPLGSSINLAEAFGAPEVEKLPDISDDDLPF